MSLKKRPLILIYFLMGSVSFILAVYLSSMFTKEVQAQDNTKTEQKKVKQKDKKPPQKTSAEPVPPPPEILVENEVKAQKKAVKAGVNQAKKVLGQSETSDKTDTTKMTSKEKSEEAEESSENKTVKEEGEEGVTQDEGVVKKIEDDPLEENELGLLEGIIENYEYKSLEGRDPFREPHVDFSEAVPLGPLVGASQVLERYELDQLRLTGVIWGVNDPKALVLDPVGQTHVVKKGQRMGKNRGKVVEIREEEIIIMESYKNQGRYSFQTRVIRLSN